jgi:hypothetical protein
MARQWPSGLNGARAELLCAPRQTAIGLKVATDGGTRRLCEHFCGMMYARIASAAVGLAAAVLVGVGLGGYTTGGFNMREPIDVIGDAAARVHKEGFSVEAPPPAPVNHVCKGCDAKLYRDDAWYSTDASYCTYSEWQREEDENRDVVRLASADDPRAQDRTTVAEADTDSVENADLAGYAGTVVARLDQ